MIILEAELERFRSETPGVNHRIHLNNAGAGSMPEHVVETMCCHLRLEAEIGGYEVAAEARSQCEAVYDSVARLIGARREEIALVENATVAWQMAFYAQSLKPGDRILTARAEYAANYVAMLRQAKRTGCTIDIIPDDSHSASDPEALEQMIDERVKLIALTHIPTNGGLINPAGKIGKIARKHNIPYLLDACQTAGQMPIDVDELGCDFLSATGRKFLRGPRGTGFLYARQKWLKTLEPFMIDHFGAEWTRAEAYELRADARRFETWENSYALRLGLGAAVDYALEVDRERIQSRAFGLADMLRHALAEIPGMKVQDIGYNKCAIVTFTHERLAAEKIKEAMATKSINISVSGPSSTRLDAEARGLPPVVRVSPHYYNSEAELEHFLTALKEIAN